MISRKALGVSAALLTAAFLFTALAVSGVRAASGAEKESLTAQLEEIAANQGTILAELAEIKESLRILTIRVTQAQ